MTTFHIEGPFPIKIEKKKGGNYLDFDSFWSDDSPVQKLGEERGCYVFAIRNRGLTPIYVGKATETFKQEAFNNTNKTKYQRGFGDYAKGTPVMYFVVHPRQKGKPNTKEINLIEDFLIQAGVAKNPNLQNVKGAQTPKWNIRGVIRDKKKGPNKQEEKDFVRLFDLKN